VTNYEKKKQKIQCLETVYIGERERRTRERKKKEKEKEHRFKNFH